MPVQSQESETVMYLCVREIDCASFCDSYIEFWECSDSVILFVCMFVFFLDSIIASISGYIRVMNQAKFNILLFWNILFFKFLHT